MSWAGPDGIWHAHRKSYYSENAFNNHVQSRKHREMEQMEDDDEQSMMSVEEKIAQVQAIREQPRGEDASVECLFCPQIYGDFDANLAHMTRDHGFFLPDTEYLADPPGLIRYLSTKIRDEHLCLYCNGRGKAWKSLDAVRAHMVRRNDNSKEARHRAWVQVTHPLTELGGYGALQNGIR